MSDVVGKNVSGHRFVHLYRVINCLDCEYPELRPRISLYNSASPINAEIRRMIKILSKTPRSLNEIAIELQYVYGRHVISDTRDSRYRTE